MTWGIYIYAYFDISIGFGFPTEHLRCQHDVFCFCEFVLFLIVKTISKYWSNAQKPYSCSGYIKDLMVSTWSTFVLRQNPLGRRWIAFRFSGAMKRVIAVSHRFKDGEGESRDGDYPREWAVDVRRLLDGCLVEGRDSIRKTMGPSLMECEGQIVLQPVLRIHINSPKKPARINPK